MPKNYASETTNALLLASAITQLNSSVFPDSLEKWLHSLFNYDNITALAYFSDSVPLLLMSNSQQSVFHENKVKDYLAGAYLLDPYYSLHLSKAPVGAYRLSDITPDNFLRSRYFLEYYKETMLADEIGFIVYPSATVSLHICLGKDSISCTRFNARDIKIAKQISPIVASLASTHWKNLDAKKERFSKATPPNLIDIVEQKLAVKLSPRQAEVAILILQGHSSNSIGMRLGISPQTVKVFRKQLYKKCQISSQAELFTLMMPMLNYDANKILE